MTQLSPKNHGLNGASAHHDPLNGILELGIGRSWVAGHGGIVALEQVSRTAGHLPQPALPGCHVFQHRLTLVQRLAFGVELGLPLIQLIVGEAAAQRQALGPRAPLRYLSGPW